MFHGTPDCPECGSRFLTFRVRVPTGVASGPKFRFYRCYRCFAKFKKEPVGEDDPSGDDREAGDDSAPEHAGPLAVTAVDLSLSPSGAKHTVERFDVTVRNDAAEPVRIARATLSFQDGEKSTVAVDDVVVAPGDTAEIEIARSWIHADQGEATLQFSGDGRTVGATGIAFADYR